MARLNGGRMRLAPTAMALGVVMALVACGGSGAAPATETAKNYQQDRPGPTSVYEEIARETNCHFLEKRLTTSKDNVELAKKEYADQPELAAYNRGYAEATTERMHDLNC